MLAPVHRGDSSPILPPLAPHSISRFAMSHAASEPTPGPTAAEPPLGPLMARLSGMFFLQYMSLGIWSVTVGTFIAANTGSAGRQMFDSWFAGFIGITAGLGALVAPLLFGALADSWIRAERLISLLNVGCAVMLWAMWSADNQWGFLIAMLAYYQCCSPSLTLASSMTLRHLDRTKHVFPLIRAIGTIGWVSSGLILGFLVPRATGFTPTEVEQSTWPMVCGCVSHLVMAVYAFKLPHTPPLAGLLNWRTMLSGLQTLVRQQPRLLSFLGVCFFAAVPAQFYGFSNLFLNQQGFQRPVTVNSLAQVSEIVGSLVLPWMILRWGPKRLFVVGVIIWGLRFVCLAFGGSQGLPLVATYLGVIAHGACFTMVYIVAAMYVGYASPPHTQSAAQGLLGMVMGGAAVLTGAGLMGWLQSVLLTPSGVVDPPYHWTPFFLIPAAMTVGVLVMFWRLMGFHREVMPGQAHADNREGD
jgi:MFS family permease